MHSLRSRQVWQGSQLHVKTLPQSAPDPGAGVLPGSQLQRGVVRWGDLRAKVIRALASPYDPNARRAAMAIGVVPDFGFSMPMEEGLLGEVFSHKKNHKG